MFLAALAGLFAIPLAWAVARTDMPGRGFTRMLVLATFITPPYTGAVAWILLAGPNAGWLNRFWILVTGAAVATEHDARAQPDHTHAERFRRSRRVFPSCRELGQKALSGRRGFGQRFEAAVAGGIPIIKALREGLVGNRVKRLYGILNGTCNYILTTMRETGRDFDVVLKEAQAAGYAEADPSFDVDGIDAAHKLAVLTGAAFGAKVNFAGVHVEGIRRVTSMDIQFAEELGYRIKLLGVAVKTEQGIEQRVHPTMVPKDSAIAQVMGVTNAVTIDAEGIAPITLVGPGAGGEATASAIIADLADIAGTFERISACRSIRSDSRSMMVGRLPELSPAEIMAR